MSDTQQEERTYTYAQLHERACIVCGEPGGLAPAGHVTVDGLRWAVAAHPGHLAEAHVERAA